MWSSGHLNIEIVKDISEILAGKNRTELDDDDKPETFQSSNVLFWKKRTYLWGLVRTQSRSTRSLELILCSSSNPFMVPTQMSHERRIVVTSDVEALYTSVNMCSHCVVAERS